MSGYTLEQLEALRSAAARGVLSLEQNGEKVTFRSQREMLQMISMIERALGGDLPRQHYPAYRKD